MMLSLLSKPAAVIFPAALFCIDILRKRKLSLTLIIEKIPFFIPALIMGILTYYGQSNTGATDMAAFFGIGIRILIGFYGIMMYFFKMILPFNLSAFYPFPARNISLPIEYYAAPFFFIVLTALVFYSLKRNRVVVFGISFYLVNLLLVLQFFPVGSAVIAERYTYIPYIGLFYIIGWLIDHYTKSNFLKASYIILPVSFMLAIGTFKLAGTWFNGATLWDHAIKTQPSDHAYNFRATLYHEENNDDKAIEYYNKSIALNVSYFEAYGNRGNVYFKKNKLDSAYADYKKAISLKPNYYPALDNLGALYSLRGQYDSSIISSTQALKIKEDYYLAYRNRAYAYFQLKRYEDAIKNYRQFLRYEPGAADIYNSIGSCYQMMKKYPDALASINKAIELDAKPIFYLNRSYAFNSLNNIEFAKRDALIAVKGGIKLESGYSKSLGIQ